MNRRTFLCGSFLGGLTAPVAAEAQQAGRVYRVGALSPDSPLPGLLENFREGLQKLGYVEERNLAIEWRDAKGRNERLGALADELVRLKVTSFWR
jgi:hypothetical protein